MGILSINSPENDARNMGAFREALQGLGHEGRNIDIDYRASSGDTKSLTGMAQELIRLKPQVILANSVTPTRVVNRIAPNLPIVCPAFSDSFVPSLATSFARPGGRVTGVATDVESLIGKLAELVFDVMPDLAEWKEEIPWMSLYSSAAVWASLALCVCYSLEGYLPRFLTGS